MDQLSSTSDVGIRVSERLPAPCRSTTAIMSPQTRDFIILAFHLYSRKQVPYYYAFRRGVKRWTVSLPRAGFFRVQRDRLHPMQTFPLVCRLWLRTYHCIPFIDMFIPSCSLYLRFIFLEKEKRCLCRIDDSEESIPTAEYIAAPSLQSCLMKITLISTSASCSLITISVGCRSSSKSTGATKYNPPPE
ncbi:hypothetical protein ARMGADRAFT_1093047 [Armillaria gallica]|uniref:Uncharacterized protein n=1 Tax=Armillaria gallica TaxID=47427 RepID=A0A2H3C7Z7_ARMGA|nr:hypothetical protein ARMGADRAFT_1093359 [Armillaria gallica]PBK79521.1 hypothetical protein ARMGADRAFT_1093047 [Armillaria gallica]